MPIYEYFCGECRHHWELIIPRDQSDAQACPQCGKPARKELSAPAFQFKGSGWYVTDYGGKGKAGGGESAKPAAAPSEAAPAAPATTAGTPATPSAGGCGSGGCSSH